jgi:hypothetical protein
VTYLRPSMRPKKGIRKSRKKSDFMSGLPFGKVRGGRGIGMKRTTESRLCRDGRIILSKHAWAALRPFVFLAYWKIFGELRCHMCGRIIYSLIDMALDHWKSPRGLGGGYRDDRFVKPACHKCNGEKGSKRDV